MKDREFRKKLFALVLPIAFQQFMLNLVSASDALILGTVGQDELSAVSLAGQVAFVQGLFLAAITIGAGIFAAQYWGKQDITSMEKIFAIAIRAVLPVGVAFFLGTALFPEAVMGLFTSEKVLIAYGAEYLRLASVSYFFCGISQIYLCMMKNSGQAGTSTWITSICVLLDAVLNVVLVLGLFGIPRLGIAGAALSTSIVRIIECIWIVLAFSKAKKLKLRTGVLLRPDKELHKDYWKYTSPVLGNELVWGIGFTMYTVIMGHLGTDAVAANSIASIAKNLVVSFCIGLGSGGGILVGNELGAGKLELAKEYGARLCRLAMFGGLASGGVLLCLSPLVLLVTNLTARAEQYLFWMLVLCSVYMVGKSVNVMTIAGIFCAGGDSKFGFRCDAITLWCITVPLGLLAAFLLKAPVLVVYLIINGDEFIKLPAVYRHYKKYLWLKDLTVKE